MPAAQTAPVLTPQAALTRLATATRVDASWFIPAFASALPQVFGGFQGFKAQFGAFQGVDDLGGDLYRLRYAGGTVTVQAQLNAAGQFTGLFLKDQQAKDQQTSVPASSSPAPQPAASAACVTPQAALTRLFSAKTLSPEWFSADFLQASAARPALLHSGGGQQRPRLLSNG